jgi:hypothetical protein
LENEYLELQKEIALLAEASDKKELLVDELKDQLKQQEDRVSSIFGLYFCIELTKFNIHDALDFDYTSRSCRKTTRRRQ